MPTFATIAALLSSAVLLTATTPALATPSVAMEPAMGVASGIDRTPGARAGTAQARTPAPPAGVLERRVAERERERERGVPFSGLDLAFLLVGGLGLVGAGMLVAVATRPAPAREPAPARASRTPAPTPAIVRR